MPSNFRCFRSVLSIYDPGMIFWHGQMYIFESQDLAASYYSERNTVAVQLVCRQVTIEALQMRAVLVITSGERIPDYIRHLLHEFSSGIFSVVDSEIDGALDHCVELGVECFGDVVFNGR